MLLMGFYCDLSNTEDEFREMNITERGAFIMTYMCLSGNMKKILIVIFLKQLYVYHFSMSPTALVHNEYIETYIYFTQM